MDRPDQKWRDKFLERLKPLVAQGNYRAAVQIAQTALKQYPTEFVCRYQYAKLLGDWADELPASRKAKYKRQSIAILRPLLRSLSGQPFEIRFGICLNYYYQSEAFPEMYAFGTRTLATNKQKGMYARGIAAGLLAQKLRADGASARSLSWARKSVAAWERFDLGAEKYYFAHYSYAKALALAGDKDQALRALKIAARLGKRPISDWEFADVREIIEGSLD